MAVPSDLSVGEFAARAGLPVSTIHFYEAKGLIESWRTPANHRRYDRRELRRVAIIRAALAVGVGLAEVRARLGELPRDRAIPQADWARISAEWRDALDRRIEHLTALRDRMSVCIGCGCLSLDACPLTNPDDRLADEGPGARRLGGDGTD